MNKPRHHAMAIVCGYACYVIGLEYCERQQRLSVWEKLAPKLTPDQQHMIDSMKSVVMAC